MRVDITCRQFIIYIVAVSGNHVDAWEDKETCFKHIKIKLNLLRKNMQIYRTLLVEKVCRRQETVYAHRTGITDDRNYFERLCT